jgi:hypothetical protein
MACSLQGITMHQKPVHDRHSKIEVEIESGEAPETGKREGRKRRTSCSNGSLLHSWPFPVSGNP